MSAGNGVRRIVRTRAVATTVWIGCAALGLLTLAAACGSTATVFNPAFINTLSGGQVPVTPGPGAAYVLVRVVNETAQVVEFVVTIEREVLVVDDEGNFEQDEQGNFITVPERETVNLTTNPTGLATDLGVLFPCGESPVTVVGLGENLLSTDAAIFVGGEGAGGATGFGVPVGAWLRQAPDGFLQDRLLASSSPVLEYLEPAPVAELVRSHLHRERDRGHEIWALLTLESWLRQERSR